MAKKPTSNLIPVPLQFLTLKELFILTGVPLHLLEGISKGEFKPNEATRRKITSASLPYYAFSRAQAHAFLQRTKFRLVKQFISPYEKKELLSDSEKYEKRLEAMFEKHWDKIVVVVTEKFA